MRTLLNKTRIAPMVSNKGDIKVSEKMGNMADNRNAVNKYRASATMKGSVLIGLVESGLIERGEDGSIDTEKFERFWDYIEPDISLSLEQQVYEFFKVREQEAKERRKECYEDAKEMILIFLPFIFLCGLLLLTLILLELCKYSDCTLLQTNRADGRGIRRGLRCDQIFMQQEPKQIICEIAAALRVEVIQHINPGARLIFMDVF